MRPLHRLLFNVSLLLLAGAYSLNAAGTPLDILWTKPDGGTCLRHPIAFSPDGKSVASTCGSLITRFRISDGEILATYQPLGDTYDLAFSPDGTTLVAGAGFILMDEEGTMSLWNVSDGSSIGMWYPCDVYYGFVLAVRFSPDGLLLAIGCGDAGDEGNHLRLWRVSDLSETMSLLGNDLGVHSVAFSSSTNFLASGGLDLGDVVKLWNLSDGTVVTNFPSPGGFVNSVEFSPNGSLLAAGNVAGSIRVWRVSDGALLHDLKITAYSGFYSPSLRFSKDGKVLISASGTLQFWRVADGTLLQTHDGSDFENVVVSPDGSLIAFGAGDGNLTLARMPLLISSITLNGTAATLRWQWGSGLYQLQVRTNLTTGSWQNLGRPTTNTSATNSLPGGIIFYRVQSLPNP